MPMSPADEFSKIKGAANPAVCLGPAQPVKSSSGLKKTPPPTPVNPERKPIPAPIATAGKIGIAPINS